MRFRTLLTAAALGLAAGCTDQITDPTRSVTGTGSALRSASSGMMVAAGSNFSCALRSSGTVTCWGENQDGQLNVPAGLSGVTSISAKGSHACALKGDGSLVCWGGNWEGQASVPSDLGPARAVSAGQSSTCVVLQSGYPRCWGWDYNSISSGPSSFTRKVTEISVNYTSTCLLAEDDGTIHCWGDNQLGGVTPPAGPFVHLSMAAWGGCAQRADGTIACWGYGTSGGSSNWFVPPAGQWAAVDANAYAACALSAAGEATCWGMQQTGSLPGPLSQVSVGSGHACAVKADGNIVCAMGGGYFPTAAEVPPEFGGPLAPTVSGASEYRGTPGVPVELTATCLDPANTGAIYCEWYFPQLDEFGLRVTGSPAYIAFPWEGTFTGQVTAVNGNGYRRSMPVTVYITSNAAPTVGAINGSVSAGGVFTAAGTFADPGSASWTATVDYGDGSGAQSLSLDAGAFSLSHAYGAAGTYSITVTVTDDAGMSGTATTTAVVANTSPVVAPLAPATIIAGGSYTASGSFTDAGSSRWTGTISWGDGSSTQSLSLASSKTYSRSHVYEAPGTYTVKVTITDNQGAATVRTTTVTVQGAAAATMTLAGQVATLAQSGAIKPAAAQLLTTSLNSAGAALSAGNKTLATAHIATAALTIARELQAQRMSSATATQLAAQLALITKAIWFP